VVVPNTRGPSFSLMPNRITICWAVAVTFSMSLEAPVVISLNQISSADGRQGHAIVSLSSARWSGSGPLGHRMCSRAPARAR